jgi:hypothetical protein
MLSKKIGLIATLFFITVSTLVYTSYHFATNHSVLHLLDKWPQNTLAYLEQGTNLKLKPSEQAKLAGQFLNYHFSPWQRIISPLDMMQIKKEILSEISKFQQKPGFGANTHPYSQEWIKNLIENIDIKHFPNANQDAITVRDSNVRTLPTLDPSFSDLQLVSKGYPFDNLQQTFIPVGTPIRIIQISKDKAWYFVMACSYSGWIPEQDVAYVNSTFKKKWQTGDYAVSTQDNIPIFDEDHRLTAKTRVGVIYPILKSSKKDFQILIPTMDTEGYGLVKSVIVNKMFLREFPVPISSFNIAEVANNLIGKPYGWGGMYGYRDCSLTMKDLLAIFGIWLPRHSQAQVNLGFPIHLSGLSNKVKEQKIVKEGIPFLTLIHLPGHIVLYVGQKNGHPIVFQNMWGLHIYKIFNKDRIVVGKTVITPLSFGKKFINASLNPLTVADSMTLLVSPRLIIPSNHPF